MRQNTTASHIYFFYRSYIIQQYSPNDNSYCQFAYFSLLRGIMQTLAAWWGAGKGGGAGERSFCSDQRALSGQARTPRGGGDSGGAASFKTKEISNQFRAIETRNTRLCHLTLRSQLLC